MTAIATDFPQATLLRVRILRQAVADFLSGFERSYCCGVVLPKNAPVEIIGTLNRDINTGLADPKMKARIADLGGTVLPGSPADSGKLIAEDTAR